ncbi:MAG: hypothetical protein AB8G96_06455 [Phycisphaerales bacterium]
MASRTTRSRSTAPPAEPACILGAPGVPAILIAGTRVLESAAMRWTYIVAHRSSWNEGARRDEKAQQARQQIIDFGVTPAQLAELAAAGLVQVTVPYDNESTNWAARIMPWEYLLSAATRPDRTSGLTVIRHLDRRNGVVDPPAVADRGMLIASAPQLPEAERDAAAERRLLENGLFRELPSDVTEMRNPSLAQIADAVAQASPAVVHFAGVDTYGGADRLGRVLLDPAMPSVGPAGSASTTTSSGARAKMGTGPAASKSARPATKASAAPVPGSIAQRAIGYAPLSGAIMPAPDVDTRQSAPAEPLTKAGFRPDALPWSAADDLPFEPTRTMTGGAATSAGGRRDGIVLQGLRGEPVAVPALSVAMACTRGAPAPSLAVFTMPRSAARTAALTVAEGASLALGVQDSLPRDFIERFVAEFYAAWRESGHDARLAFELAWAASRDVGGNLTGSGLVLWSGTSLLPANHGVAGNDRDAVRERLDQQRDLVQEYPDLAAARAALIDPADIVPRANLNYSLLHNRQPMFDRFRLLHRGPGTVDNVLVEVDLLAGPERLPWRGRIAIGPTPLSLVDDVFLPLTSRLARSLDEHVQGSLTVRISIDGLGILHDRSYRVTLLPIAEWTDTDADRHWLPSFVYPMDPAVRTIIDAAQPYLEAIADDPRAGFDGYQSIDDAADAPSARVDAQVAAIWAALLHDMPLGYINPPPVYSEASQRLRTPAETIRGGRGTCLDLALLFGSCLEYIDVHPVIFLMQGHAFPGWWRSDVDRERFFSMDYLGELDDEAIEDMVGSAGRTNVPSWIVPRSRWADVRDQIADGRLVPIETVWMTIAGGFGDAMDEGWENILAAGEFDCMVDVTAARRARQPVTPLPRAGMDRAVEFGADLRGGPGTAFEREAAARRRGPRSGR